MAVSRALLGACMFLSVMLLRVDCSKEHLKGRGLVERSVEAEYDDWIASVRFRHEARSTDELGDTMVQPDLSLDYPGMKQYVDWESILTPSTYIVVDQNGLGNFFTLNDAVNSIPRDRYRQYRITIQLNAGVYRCAFLPLAFLRVLTSCNLMLLNVTCREKVFIERTRPMITLQGVGQPTIVWNDTNFLSGNHTFDSATFGVAGNFFLAKNVTFQVLSSLKASSVSMELEFARDSELWMHIRYLPYVYLEVVICLITSLPFITGMLLV